MKKPFDIRKMMTQDLHESPARTFEDARKKASEGEKVSGVREIALVGSRAKGIPLFGNSNYAVVIDAYDEKKMEEVKEKLGGKTSIVFITPRDLARLSSKRKQTLAGKAVSATAYVLTKAGQVEKGSRSLIEIKMPKIRHIETDPRILQTWEPISKNKELIGTAQEKQRGIMKPNPIFQKQGFKKTVENYLDGGLSEAEAVKFLKEEPKAAEYVWRFMNSERNMDNKEKLFSVLQKLKKI